jgi:UDP-glucose 4-epimerase
MPIGDIYAGDGIDLCYLGDCARALVLLQTSPNTAVLHLQHPFGTCTTNSAFAEAIRAVVPDAELGLVDGASTEGVPAYLAGDRLKESTGFFPATDAGVHGRAVRELVAVGHARQRAGAEHRTDSSRRNWYQPVA